MASWVDEKSPANPLRETGQILRKAEDLVLGTGGAVARLAGLYGPGRCVPLQKLLDGKAIIEGNGERVMNMLHQLDAAGALRFLAETQATGLFNAVDNEPVPELEWFRYVCDRLNQPIPLIWPARFEPKTRLDQQTREQRKIAIARLGSALSNVQGGTCYDTALERVRSRASTVSCLTIPDQRTAESRTMSAGGLAKEVALSCRT